MARVSHGYLLRLCALILINPDKSGANPKPYERDRQFGHGSLWTGTCGPIVCRGQPVDRKMSMDRRGETRSADTLLGQGTREYIVHYNLIYSTGCYRGLYRDYIPLFPTNHQQDAGAGSNRSEKQATTSQDRGWLEQRAKAARQDAGIPISRKKKSHHPHFSLMPEHVNQFQKR